MRYSYLTGDEIPVEDFDDPKNLLENYALTILGKIILLEERQSGRMSGLRIFCRLDVGVFRDQATGEHCFFVNEVTRTHTAALFQEFLSHQMADPVFSHLSDLLHMVALRNCFLVHLPYLSCHLFILFYFIYQSILSACGERKRVRRA